MEDRKFAIIGGGPTGGILCAGLVQKVADLALVDIDTGHLEAIRKNGLRITGVSDIKVGIERLYNSVNQLEEYDPDVIIVATKTWVLANLLPELERLHRPGRVYILAQNGLDSEVPIAEKFGAENTLRMVINYAGNPVSPGVLKMTFFNPPNYVGGATPEIEPLANKFASLLSSVELATVYSGELRRRIWKKTIMNAAMSPISALTGQTMLEVMQCEGTRQFLRRVMCESVVVAGAEGIDFDEDFVESCMNYMMKAGHHKTSMLLDVENGSPTEVDSLCGRIAIIGRKFGIDTLYNESLTILILGTEAAKGVCKGFRTGVRSRDEAADKTCGLCPYESELVPDIVKADDTGKKSR